MGSEMCIRDSIYIAPPSTPKPWYVKENRYIPLYMVVLGRYMVVLGGYGYIAPLWPGMARVHAGMALLASI